MMKRKILILTMLLACSVSIWAQNPDAIVGKYSVVSPTTKIRSIVEIHKNAAGKYEGNVLWLEVLTNASGDTLYDVHNPDPSKRHIRCDKIRILTGFVYDPNHDRWENGLVYDPESGDFYHAQLKFENETRLKLRGYVGIPLFGRTIYWTKIK